jgi:hypothetical protein
MVLVILHADLSAVHLIYSVSVVRASNIGVGNSSPKVVVSLGLMLFLPRLTATQPSTLYHSLGSLFWQRLPKLLLQV